MTDATPETGDERCDYHYYLLGDAPYPAFMCGLPKNHEGEHVDATKLVFQQLSEKFKNERRDT